MERKLRILNLSHLVDRQELERLFAPFGVVRAARVVDQLATSSGTTTGFVEMDSEAESEAAIAALNGKQYRGSVLLVLEAAAWNDSGSRANASR